MLGNTSNCFTVRSKRAAQTWHKRTKLSTYTMTSHIIKQASACQWHASTKQQWWWWLWLWWLIIIATILSLAHFLCRLRGGPFWRGYGPVGRLRDWWWWWRRRRWCRLPKNYTTEGHGQQYAFVFKRPWAQTRCSDPESWPKFTVVCLSVSQQMLQQFLKINRYILIIKPTRCTNFSNLFLE